MGVLIARVAEGPQDRLVRPEQAAVTRPRLTLGKLPAERGRELGAGRRRVQIRPVHDNHAGRAVERLAAHLEDVGGG